jgi:hypothetical protein
MPLFGRRSKPDAIPNYQDGVPGLNQMALQQGWFPLPADKPFGGRIEEQLHRAARVMGGMRAGRTEYGTVQTGTFYSDVYGGSVDGRNVMVANAATGVMGRMHGTAVCVVELTTILPIMCVQSRRFYPMFPAIRETPVGNPAFDDRFAVYGAQMGAVGPAQVLTPEVQQRIMARDDWVFVAESYLLACLSHPRYQTVDQVGQRIGEVLGIVGAIPASVAPATMDHSQDDLAARISQLNGLDDAMAFLQGLSPAEREQLARSDTPLSVMADVTTPQQAMSRFQSLDQARKMQLIAMFQRVEDERRMP